MKDMDWMFVVDTENSDFQDTLADVDQDMMAVTDQDMMAVIVQDMMAVVVQDMMAVAVQDMKAVVVQDMKAEADQDMKPVVVRGTADSYHTAVVVVWDLEGMKDTLVDLEGMQDTGQTPVEEVDIQDNSFYANI